jgi:hypothetical protein
MSNTSNYIYLLQEREFIKTKENIYKVGKTTKDNLTRFNQYPKGSKLLFQIIVIDCHDMERRILNKFNDSFTIRKDYGNEYFEGNYEDMIDIIFSTIKNYSKCTDDSKCNDEIYTKWIETSNIDKIIITNKIFKDGYFLLKKSNIWVEFTPEESLEGLIKHNQIDELVSSSDLISYICNKFYVSDFEPYKLKYNEYLIRCHMDNNNTLFIFDSINCTFTPLVNGMLHDKVVPGSIQGSGIIYIKKNTDIDIVNNIMKSLVINDNIIRNYKKLAYNILVRPEKEEIIFYDYEECLLTDWIRDLLYCISKQGYLTNSYEYYSNKTEYIEQIKGCKPRCIVISNYLTDVSITNQINDFRKLGIKYMIIQPNVHVRRELAKNAVAMYNISRYIDYIKDNRFSLIEILKKEHYSDVILSIQDWEQQLVNIYKLNHYDNIFSKQRLFLTNFLKWCCTL